MSAIRLYSRPRCGLCDRARATILALRAEVAFEFEEVSIEGDDDLEREYGVRVPVVLLDGEERFALEVDRDDLRMALGA